VKPSGRMGTSLSNKGGRERLGDDLCSKTVREDPQNIGKLPLKKYNGMGARQKRDQSLGEAE